MVAYRIALVWFLRVSGLIILGLAVWTYCQMREVVADGAYDEILAGQMPRADLQVVLSTFLPAITATIALFCFALAELLSLLVNSVLRKDMP